MLVIRSGGGDAELRGSTLENPSADLVKALTLGGGGWTTATGKNVTPDSAVKRTIAVYRSVAILAEGVGSLPMKVFQDRSAGGRERLPETNPTARMLHQQPNRFHTAFGFYENVVGHAALWGNHVSYIVRNGRGEPVALIPLRPDCVEPVYLLDGRPADPSLVSPSELAQLEHAIIYTRPGSSQHDLLLRREVFHVPALAIDSLGWGLSPISVARNAIAVEQSAGEYAAGFYARGAVPGGMLVSAKKLTEEGADRLYAQWQRLHGGTTNAQRVAVMDTEVSWQSVGMPLKDAQFIETRRFEISEIAMLFGVTPRRLGMDERSANRSTAEQDAIEHVRYTLRPWMERIEQAANRDLGVPGKTLRDRGLTAEFDADALLRGDTLSRYRAHAIGRQWGWLNADDIRLDENLPPIPDGKGQIYLEPMNTNPAGESLTSEGMGEMGTGDEDGDA